MSNDDNNIVSVYPDGHGDYVLPHDLSDEAALAAYEASQLLAMDLPKLRPSAQAKVRAAVNATLQERVAQVRQ